MSFVGQVAINLLIMDVGPLTTSRIFLNRKGSCWLLLPYNELVKGKEYQPKVFEQVTQKSCLPNSGAEFLTKSMPQATAYIPCRGQKDYLPVQWLWFWQTVSLALIHQGSTNAGVYER
jgi:hypothetical protein